MDKDPQKPVDCSAHMCGQQTAVVTITAFQHSGIESSELMSRWFDASLLSSQRPWFSS